MDEDGSIQSVCAELLGLIQTPISVTLATLDGSATSTLLYNATFNLISMNVIHSFLLLRSRRLHNDE